MTKPKKKQSIANANEGYDYADNLKPKQVHHKKHHHNNNLSFLNENENSREIIHDIHKIQDKLNSLIK